MDTSQHVNLLEVFLNMLQGSSLRDSKAFYHLNRDFPKWLILSDYTHRLDEKTHETYCFSIAPVFFDLQQLRATIGSQQPTDLKSTQRVSDDFLEFVASERFLHFVFSFGDSKQNPFLGSSIQNTRETLHELRSYAKQVEEVNRGNPDFVAMSRRLHLAEQESKKAGFNYVLFDKIVLISGIAAALACLITKHTGARGINWMSDRDNVTTYCDGILYDLFSMSYSGGNYRLANNRRCELWSSHDERNGKMWFDELIRIPDFIAGAFSRISLRTGSINLSKQSHVVQKTQRVVHFFTVKKESDGLVVRRERVKT
jgi:hypothetical protein